MAAQRPKKRNWRLTTETKVLLALLVLLLVLGLVLHGLASTLAWVLFVLVIAFIIGPGLSPQSSTWQGPYKNRRLH